MSDISNDLHPGYHFISDYSNGFLQVVQSS